MNLPKIGDHIIVRYDNGLLPREHLHKIYPVVGVEENYEGPIAANGVDVLDPRPAVFFSTAPNLRYYTTEWHIVPKIGDTVRPTAGLGDNRYYGQACTVTEVIPNEVGVLVRGEFTSLQKPDDSIVLGFSEWEVADAPASTVDELQAEIAKLKADLDEMRVRYESADKRAEGWRIDFQHLSNSLLEEAEARGWCNEYEEFCDSVDEGLQYGEMPRREKEYTVTWQTYVTVSVDMSRTYTATSEENAIEMAMEDYYGAAPEEDDVVEAVRSGNWEDSDDPYREYEAEEA